MLDIATEIGRLTSSKNCQLGAVIQELWSGYGVIQKANIDGSSVVIKHIDLSKARANRRGWNGDFSHKRKVHSYFVETQFYRTYAERCSNECRTPRLLAVREDKSTQEILLVLEDLDSAGFGGRKTSAEDSDIKSCIHWLANFHATFLNATTNNLWDVGTYWNLATRPDEWEAMAQCPLKEFAGQIDSKLNLARFKTLVHGDAKIANFCFRDQADRLDVAAVDFQYVGGGVGVKDLAYFISSCMDDQAAEELEGQLLDLYFQELFEALNRLNSSIQHSEIESEWRTLYPYAWADFCRFLLGWSPGHWKLNRYSTRLSEQVVAELRKNG